MNVTLIADVQSITNSAAEWHGRSATQLLAPRLLFLGTDDQAYHCRRESLSQTKSQGVPTLGKCRAEGTAEKVLERSELFFCLHLACIRLRPDMRRIFCVRECT